MPFASIKHEVFMSFPILVFDEKKKAEFEAEGRGTKEGAEWKAWYTLGDFSPHYRTQSRFTCLYTERSVFLPTALMRLCWNALELDPDTVEILEIAPLDREITREIAKSIGVDHPRDSKSKVDLVLTTSLIAKKRRNGAVVREPIQCTSLASLDSYGTIEDLQIQNEYWRRHGQTLTVFTGAEGCISQNMARNIDTLANHRLPQFDPPEHPGRFQSQCVRIVDKLMSATGDSTLTEWAHLVAPSIQSEPSQIINVLLHLVARRRIYVDLDAGPVMRQSVEQAVRNTRDREALLKRSAP